jgi:uncharacterized protein (DUF433 family)
MTSEAVLDRHIVGMSSIPVTPGVAGRKLRIVGRRITVQNIAIWLERRRLSADEIASEYDLGSPEKGPQHGVLWKIC